MKKNIGFIILLLLMFSVELNAKKINMPFNKAKEISNNYIETSSKHEYYLINGNNLYFGFNDNNKIFKNNNFIKGGLLNLQEYKVSFVKNKSYLKSGINYWTMTDKLDQYYVITESKQKLENINDNVKHEARISEYVKKDTYVSGSGTYKDPWQFRKLNTIVFVSTDESKGLLDPVKTYAFDGQDLAISVNLIPGYEYASNTCGITDAGNNGINVRNISDDMFCEVSFKEKTYTVTYDNNGGSGCTNKKITFNSTYGDLCTPVRSGYKFMGWFNDKAGTVQINKDTKVTEPPYTTLYAKWVPTKISCSDLEGKVKCNNLSASSDYLISYSGNCEFICDDRTNGNWRIKFKTVGNVSFKTNLDLKVDAFLVGGGGNGSSGGGGGGGYTNTFKQITFKDATSYTFKVGNAAQSTSITGGGLNYSVSPGNAGNGPEGGNGGSGGGGQAVMVEGNIWGGSGGSYGSNGGEGYGCTYPGCNGYRGGRGQGRTTCEFGEGTTSGCTRGNNYAYSGGGGGNNYAWNDIFGYQSGQGGTRGGGRAGGGYGAANTGGGGGAGSGRGGSGIIVIRNAR